ncbi:hypothetical protein [Streptomyces sp. NPDC050738]|uniref:hypothetical protein n=1 Tax=Streptomyces sp. NPDC050738 TaxID=3154744 RepID=UPI00341DCD33
MVRRQCGAAAAAVVAAMSVLGVGIFTVPDYVFGIWLVTAGVVALPLVLCAAPKAFARACLLTGTTLVVWGVLGLLLGLCFFLPAALLLLVAAFADSDNWPGWQWVVCAPAFAVTLTALLAV